jgi:DNA-directed RNA polymerase III subunit RPC1
LLTLTTPRSGTTGYIRLELPVFHVGYFKNIVAILQCVCKTCARVMVPEDERRQYLRRFRSPHTEVRAAPARLLAFSLPTRW